MTNTKTTERTSPHHSVDREPLLGRRSLLLGLSAGALLTPLISAESTAHTSRPLIAPTSSGPNNAHDEAYWADVAKQFHTEKNLIMLNAANMSPTPTTVHNSWLAETENMRANPSFQNRGRYGNERETTRKLIAGFVGANPREIALVRNTTEGNNTIVNGLDLGPGDEVVIWDQNHPCNGTAWIEKSKRYGFTVKTVTLPESIQSVEDLISPFKAAMSSRTKVIAFSHISNATGITLPAKELCTLARQNGALSLADGAQSFGYMPLNLHDMGCDFYTTSGQKWLMGPREASFLYVRESANENLWPTMVTHGWETDVKHGARKFESLGQRDDGRLVALQKAVEFQKVIGSKNIEARVNYLTTELRQGLLKAIPTTQFLTTQAPGMISGILVGIIPGVNGKAAAKTIYQKYHIAGAIRGDDKHLRFRVCPHILLSKKDIQRTVQGIAASLAT